MRIITNFLPLFLPLLLFKTVSGGGYGYRQNYGPLSPLYGSSEGENFAGSSFLDADEFGHEQYKLYDMNEGTKLDSDEDSMSSKYASMFGIASGAGNDKNDNGFYAGGDGGLSGESSGNYFGGGNDGMEGGNGGSRGEMMSDFGGSGRGGEGDDGFKVRFLNSVHNNPANGYGDISIGRPKGWGGNYRTLPGAVSIHRGQSSSSSSSAGRGPSSASLYTGKSSGLRESAGNLQHDADTIGQQAQKLGVRVPAKGTVPGAMRRPRYQRVRPLRKPMVRTLSLSPMASETKPTFIGGAGVYQQKEK